MNLGWLSVADLPFEALLLLERFQIRLLPDTGLHTLDLGRALKANPSVDWYFRHQCPEISPWLDQCLEAASLDSDTERVRGAEVAVLAGLNDWLVYAINPAIYDDLPFSYWPGEELTSVVDLRGKIVLDVGAGTGRLALIAAPLARTVFVVEPVENLRRYARGRVRAEGHHNVFVVDGLIDEIPFPDGFFDAALSAYVFGGEPEAEHRELSRVTRPGGMIVHCPGTSRVPRERPVHEYLLWAGYEYGEFHDGEGVKRKYWKSV